MPHHQSVARQSQKSKLVADFGLMMHLTWARQLLDNREFVLVEGRHPSSDPNHGRDDAGHDRRRSGPPAGLFGSLRVWLHASLALLQLRVA